MQNDLYCNWSYPVNDPDDPDFMAEGCQEVPVFKVERLWDDHAYCYCARHWRQAFHNNPEFPMIDYTNSEAQRDQWNADAPWRDALRKHEIKMDVMVTRDGTHRIEWMYQSNCGNIDAGFVIYEPGDDAPSLCSDWEDVK